MLRSTVSSPDSVSARCTLSGNDPVPAYGQGPAAELRAALAEYVGAGRKVGSAQRRSTRSGARRAANGQPTPSEVRDWAKSQGIEVRDRGRVPAELIVKFKAAQH